MWLGAPIASNDHEAVVMVVTPMVIQMTWRLFVLFLL